jgi:Cu/Ag efflux protein CusF
MRVVGIVLSLFLVPGLAARGATPSAFERRCIPAGCVAPPSNIPGIPGRRALPAGRLAVLGATMELHHGLLSAQEAEKKAATAKADRVTGTIHTLDKEAKTLTVQRGNEFRQVVWNEKTKVTYQNKNASVEDVQQGRRVICLGTFNDKQQLVATRIDIRTK